MVNILQINKCLLFTSLISNFRFWPSVFLEVDVFYQLPPVHSGVHRRSGTHDLAIFRQHVLRRDNRFLGRVCWSNARSTSVLQELRKQVHTWHEVLVWDCQLDFFSSSDLNFLLLTRSVLSRAGAHECSPKFVLGLWRIWICKLNLFYTHFLLQ